MSMVTDVLNATGIALVTVSFVAPFYVHRSRFSKTSMVKVEVAQGPEWRMQLLRDLLAVLGVFAPLSLASLTIGSYLSRISQSAALLGVLAFLIFLSAIIGVLVILTIASHSGRPISLNVAPAAIGLLIAGCGVSLLSLAQVLS